MSVIAKGKKNTLCSTEQNPHQMWISAYNCVNYGGLREIVKPTKKKYAPKLCRLSNSIISECVTLVSAIAKVMGPSEMVTSDK